MNPFNTSVAIAQDIDKAKTLLGKIEKAIIDPIILFAFMVAMIVFFWGIVKFINGTDNPTAQKDGKSNMIWGIVGMTIMVSAYGILQIIAGTVATQSTLRL